MAGWTDGGRRAAIRPANGSDGRSRSRGEPVGIAGGSLYVRLRTGRRQDPHAAVPRRRHADTHRAVLWHEGQAARDARVVRVRRGDPVIAARSLTRHFGTRVAVDDL